jgi:hypothetical protein
MLAAQILQINEWHIERNKSVCQQYANKSIPADFVCCFPSEAAENKQGLRTKKKLSAYSTGTVRGHSQTLYVGPCTKCVGVHEA